MKRKLFFITFLMLFCSSMFGQHWTMTNTSQYNNSMTMFALVELDGEEQSDEDIELAAFCEGALRGVTKPSKATDSNGNERYLYQLNIYGNNNGDNLRFKIYVPGTGSNVGKEYDTDYTTKFVVGGEIWGDNENYEPLSINFYEKHFVVENDYELTMTVGATVKINGVDPKRTDLELAALCGEEVRGVTKAIYWESQNMYYYELTVGGKSNGEEITFKLYDPIAGVDLSTDYKAIFNDGGTIDDGHGNPLSIEFKNNPVARIGAEGNAARYFSTLEAAFAAAEEGETIVLLQDVELTETLTIEKNVIIDLNEKNVTLSTGGNMIKSNVTIKNGNIAIADVDTKTTGNSNCFISTNVGSSLTLDDIVMTGDGYTTHWAVLCAMSSSTTGSTINITNSTITLSNEKGSQGGFIKDQSGVNNYSQINISNSTLTLNNVSRGFTGAKVTLDDVDLTITGGEHGINGSELVIRNGSNVSISKGTGRAITLNKFDASIAGSNVTISNMGEGGIRYKTANTLTVDASSTLSETTAHADVDNAKLNDKVVRGKENQMSTVKVENGVTTVINPVAGQVAYRAYIEDTENREAVKVDLQNVNALQSLVVKLYDANGNLLTETTYKAGAVEVPDYLTCNIVLWGTASGSWETVISAEKLTVDNYPYKAELVIDGSVINTFVNILGNATDAAAYQLPAYKALDCVYKAASITREGETEYYGTLAAAVNASQENDEIVLLDNVTDVDATISKKVALNLNEKTITDAYIIVTSEVNIKNGSIKNVNESYPLVVQNGGKLTVDNVHIEASKSDRAIWVRSGSELVFNNGSSILATKGEENNKTGLIAAIYTDTNTNVTINNGTTIAVDTPDNKAVAIYGNYGNANVTVNGGKISTSGKNYSYGINVDGNIKVTGGEIVTNEKGYGYSSGIRYGYNYALVAAIGNVEITGGTITTNGRSGYIVNVGRTYSSNDQTVSITGGTFVNNLSEVEMTTGGHNAPVFIWTGTASKVTATIEGGNFAGFSEAFLRTDEDDEETTLKVSGGTFDKEIEEELIAPGFMLKQNENGTYGVVVDLDYNMVAKIGETRYATLAAAVAAVQEGETIQLLPVTIEEGTVKLPATLKNVTVKGAEGAVLKDMTVMAADGNSINYDGITFDGVVFENSRISVTGWRTNGAVVKNFTVTNCVFKDLDDTTNSAPVHINMADTEAVNGFTFTNNVIDGATGGSKSGVYAQVTGKTVFTGNTINNVSFRPYIIQLTTDDGVADEFTVTGNTFSGSAVGRAQGLGNNAEGTDEVTLTVSNNIFKNITDAQQICYWNFNAEKTTATLEKNYYDIDIAAKPDRIYYNGPASSVADLYNMGIYPIYTELNEDGTINEASLFKPVAYNGTVAYATLAEAFAGQEGTIVLLESIELTEGVVVAADKTFTLDLNGKVVSGVSNTAGSSAVITNNGNLTVKTSVEGGKITSIADNPDQNSTHAYVNNTITNCGVLTLESGTIENSTEQGLACFSIDNNSTSRDAIVNIKGGIVTGRGAIRQFANSETNENKVNVEGGKISGTSYAIWVQNPSDGSTVNTKDTKAELNISAGELGKILLEASASFEVAISGGTISEVAFWEKDETNPERNPSNFITGGTFGMDVTEYCAFNYVCNQNENGTYGVGYKPQDENSAFVIETIHELKAFRDAVNAGNTFAGQTVVLSADVDLAPSRAAAENWIPIGTKTNPFKGTFDGGNNTISNLFVEGEANQGLFGYADNATIKNVKIVNATVTGTDCVGAIAGQVYSVSLIDNCHVSGTIKIEGQTNVGGIVGKYYTKVTNCSVIGDVAATSYVKGTWVADDFEGDNIGGIMGHCGENNSLTGHTVKNITVSGTRKVGGIVGIADQNTDVQNCLVESVTVETTATVAYANSKVSTMSIGALIGQYQAAGSTNDGTVKECVVKNVTFNNVNDVTVDVGPIVGGARGGSNGMVAPSENIVSEGNLIYMSAITGSNNLYLMNAVAKIGETKYYTLQDAVSAAGTDATTIEVIANTAETINVQEGAKIIINDINLTGSILAPNAELAINGGTISNTNSGNSAVQINAGKLELNNLTITSARHAIRIEGTNGEVVATINGGTYKLNAVAGQTQYVLNAGGDGSQVTVTINGGTFVGPKGMASDSGAAVNVQNKASVTIKDGDFSGGKNNTLSKKTYAELIVYGGTFDQNVTAYCAEGYVCQKNAEGKYEVFFAVAKIGEVYYKKLADAVAAGGDITVLSNITLTETVKVVEGQNINLDLNGKTIDGTDNVKIAIMSYGNLTIKDSTTEKNGTIKAGIGAAGNTINVCAGTFTFESGNIYSKNNAILIDEEAATVNIKGGTITAEPNTDNSAAFYISSTSETTVNIEAGEIKGYNGILLWNNTTLNITGGSITAEGRLAIQGNGSKDNTEINISGNVVITGQEAAIYHPQGGDLNISGGTISGETGIIVKGGNVNISAGTINGTGAYAEYEPVSSGFKGTGDALYVEHYDNSTNSSNYGTPVVTVTGGTFNSTNAKPIASYVNTNNNIEAIESFVSGGTFNKQIDEDLCVVGFVCEENTDGTYSVKFADYIVLPTGVNASNYETYFGENTVTDGTNYYATLQEAVETVVGQADAILYCKPGADVGSLQHAPVTSTLTVYGNDAYVSGDTERDFDLGNTDTNGPGQGQVITADMTLTVKHLDGCGAWGTKATEYTVNLVFENCDNMGKVFINGNTGTLNITMTDCAFEGVISEAVYSNADGAITLTNVAFSNLNKAVNLNHKAAGTQTVTMTGCSFTDCGNDVSNDQIPVRVLTSVEGGKSMLAVKDCTFTGTPEGGADILLDYGVGLTEATITETNAKVVIERKNNEPEEHNVVDTQEYAFNNLPYVAKIGETNFTSLQAAIDATTTGQTVVVLENITLTETLTVAADDVITLDLNGKTVSQEKAQTGNYQMILNDGNLTIKDSSDPSTGKISYKDSGNGGEYVSNTITNRGTITVVSGTIENLSSATVAQNGYPYAIDSSIWGEAAEVNTNIEGGEINCVSYSALRLCADSETESVNITITGGVVKGRIEVQNPSSNKATKGTLKITGGEVYKNNSSKAIMIFGGGGTGKNLVVSIEGGYIDGEIGYSLHSPITGFNKGIITGGTFTTDVNEFCHEYYDAITENNITWTVKQVLFAQSRTLTAGWNWFSSYINLSKDNGLEKLQNAIAVNYENGVGSAVIKGQTNNQSSQYGYVGTLEGVDYYQWTGVNFAPLTERMYMINTSEAIAAEDFLIEGEKVDYETTTIALFQGWNWISYPLDEPTLINDALKNLETAQTGDQIKWYGSNFVTYMNGKWYPENFTMQPGQGYMYKAAKSGSFTYSKGTEANRGNVNSNMMVEDNHWIPAISEYANNMTITAMLSIDNEIVNGDYEIAAFANGECRGSARPIYIEELNVYVLLMTVFGDDVEELTFKYYDVNYETEYELSNRINYSDDAVVGSIDEPYMFNLNILNIEETSIDQISIYPNPTTTSSEINLQAMCDKVEVFNALGVKVAEYSNVDSIDALETAGIYVIRVTIDGNARNCRLVVK